MDSDGSNVTSQGINYLRKLSDLTLLELSCDKLTPETIFKLAINLKALEKMRLNRSLGLKKDVTEYRKIMEENVRQTSKAWLKIVADTYHIQLY